MQANLEALRVLRACQTEQRPATSAEHAVLARWSGWGAVPTAFDDSRTEFSVARATLRQLLDAQDYAAAARNTLNAHYTDPALVTAIWSALHDLGFDGGRVLEPGCGSCTFIGLAPERADLVGVELDPTTAGIAGLLYPHAQILAESFADTRAPEGSFDLVVGNVPFAKVALNDPRHNPSRHSIHNHFLIKSLHLTAPGGLVALITSRYTMDAANPAARREMAELADLVGAIRLPSSAHQRTAGTTVVTDLLILRRREPGRPPAHDGAWERTELATAATLAGAVHGDQDAAADAEADPVQVNRYFLEHPELVCGQLGVGRGMHSGSELTVTSAQPTPELLTQALRTVVSRARHAGLTHRPVTTSGPRPVALVGRAADLSEGHISTVAATTGDATGFQQLVDGAQVPFAVPASQRDELTALLGLRDHVVALLAAEAASVDDTADITRLRTGLNDHYDRYVARWGPINRFSTRLTGRIDPVTGEQSVARINPRQGGFRIDPHAPLVYALEHFDPATQQADKATILSERVIAPRVPRLGADTPADALAICLDTHGQVELDEIARLLGTTPALAREQLGKLVFDDPAPTAARAASAAEADTDLESPGAEPRQEAEPPALIAATDYLSGDVRLKLETALVAAAVDDRFSVNVTALRAVVPADVAPEHIHVSLGAPWIGQPHVEKFLQETFADSYLVAEHAYGVAWTVKGRKVGVEATETWGTPDLPAPQLAQTLLRQQPVIVHDEIEVGDTTRRVVNAAKTAAAQAKAEELAERFAEWVWSDPTRAAELAATYNRQFNSLVLRSYDDVTLTLPGLAKTFTPRPHQVVAVARMIAEPAVGPWHEVGAGKTAEMAMGVMELRRLGLVAKPAIVIPNHMIEQFTREFQQLYPRAKLLPISSNDLTRDKRRQFVARIATGTWDAVIITRGAFERIPMSPQAQADYLSAQQDHLRDAIARQEANGERSLTLKQLQRKLLSAEEKAKERLVQEHDPAVLFERTGIDYLCIDEAHDYKNLHTPSNIPSASIPGSTRAADLDMKLHYLRRQHPDGRVVTLASATPIANSVTEAHVMLRYLRPDLLQAAGVADFDSWAATFGKTISDIELSPDGGQFRIKQRFAKFHNVPELLRMWWIPGDVKTAEDLNLPRPALWAGPDGRRAPTTVLIPPSQELGEFIGELGSRAELVASRRVQPHDDNMLMISSDGRAAALDLRLVGLRAPRGESKIEVAADNIAAIWSRHQNDRFVTADGQPAPTPGALQIVFCDLGTPKPRSQAWSVYGELKRQLVARGMPAEQVRFVQEARNKGELFAACRSGQVSVLIGSTATMGVGTNIQNRAVALHHLDCPWRPADIAQREGRILRWGNQYAEVGIYRYVVEGSFDAYSWQTVARKAAFIAQLMRGKLDVREIDDIGDTALSFNEVKALAAGNPLLLDKARADTELARLERLERAHTASRDRLHQRIEDHTNTVTHTDGEIETLTAAIAVRVDTRADRFVASIDGARFVDRAEAGEHLRAWLQAAINTTDRRVVTVEDVVRLGGHTFDAQLWRVPEPGYVLFVQGVQSQVRGHGENLVETAPASLVVRLENELGRFDRYLREAQLRRDTYLEEIKRARDQLGRPFTHAAALSQARLDCARIDQQLAELAAPPEPAPEADVDPAEAKLDPAERSGSSQEAAAAARAAGRASAATGPPAPAHPPLSATPHSALTRAPHRAR